MYMIGFFGLLMIMVPTYAVIPLCNLWKVDYFYSYPAMLPGDQSFLGAGRRQRSTFSASTVRAANT